MSFISRSIGKLVNKADIIASRNKLLNSQWLKVNDGNDKITYSFLSDKRLIIATNGNGREGKWEFIVDNYTLIIEDNFMEVFNCNIINDEFLILNKDNTTDIQIFGNLTKFKNKSINDVQLYFNRFFSYLTSKNSIIHEEKLYVLKIYELKSLLEEGTDKDRAFILFNELAYDANSGAILRSRYKEILGVDITEHLRNARFRTDDTKYIVQPLIRYGIIKAK